MDTSSSEMHPPMPLLENGAAGPAQVPLATTHVTQKLRALDEEIAVRAKAVIEGIDAEAVHDFRVSLRQLRTLLKLARPLYGRFLADAVRASFAALQHATGELRDEEALEETVLAMGIKHHALTAWQTRRASKARALRRAVVDRVSSNDLAHARELLHALLILPTHPKRERPLGVFAAQKVEEALADAERRATKQTSDSIQLHELRIACKRLRYTVEFFEDDLPESLRALRKPATKLQKVLGDVHDLDVALVVMQRQYALPAPLRSRVLRALTSRRAQRLADFEDLRTPPDRLPPPPPEQPLLT